MDSEAFALRVTDASMAPEFPPGCIVIVDPGLAPAPGRFVVAETATGIVLRRLVQVERGWELQALAAPGEAEAVSPAAIRGTVTQRAGRRRREHRRYD